jgi:hypothetical protein
MKATIRQVPYHCYRLLPYRRSSCSPESKQRRQCIANDEDSDRAHEKGHGRQCKDIVGDIPSSRMSMLIQKVFHRRYTHQKCQCCLYQAHSSGVFSPHSNIRIECNCTGADSHPAMVAESTMDFVNADMCCETEQNCCLILRGGAASVESSNEGCFRH